ncbi:hypothetical protein SAMN06265222_102482 [Neorhodopirellula lusitana]|uniref:Potassium channel protein n=1 Tax=Neorhodopirellula lusitana TaxID=445327 RepID=A0ABY1PW03_9BACT|nr:potassium channel protein [Neorhodopirellula lusitana]SMP48933.1 hypothetical protein SAMN06265222_102482 [Neorhodopirellula lusitana]
MFAAAVTFLVCQAVLIVLWVDVPSLREKALGLPEISVMEPVEAEPGTETGRPDTSELKDSDSQFNASETGVAMHQVIGPLTNSQQVLEQIAVGLMYVVWPLVMLESLYHWTIRPKTWTMRWYHFYSLLFCVCPSLRMCARSVEMNGRLWLPGLNWQRPNRRLRRRLGQHFSIPMIGIALLILPVLTVEFLLKEQVARYGWLRFALHVGTGVIWFAFAGEFILMVSIAEKKFDYIRRNWVDLAIIVLPFFSFLRSLQAVRGSRLARLAKIPQLTKLVRAYRLRGTVLKAFRALVLLDVSARLFRSTPEKQITRLRTELTTIQREARLIRLMIVRLEREIEQDNASKPAEMEEPEDSEGKGDFLETNLTEPG